MAQATSPLLNGEWDLVYAGGRGPGLLAFPPLLAGAAAAARAPDGLVQLRRTKVAISRTQPRVLASGEAALLGGLGPFAPQLAVALAVESTLEAESDLRLKVTTLLRHLSRTETAACGLLPGPCCVSGGEANTGSGSFCCLCSC